MSTEEWALGTRLLFIWSFALCKNLTSLTISEDVTSIGGWVFADRPNLTIHASRDSAAEKYAKEKKIKFEATVSR